MILVINIFVGYLYYKNFIIQKEPYLKVYFLDIGQGDATYIEAPNGSNILIDGGPPEGGILKQLGEVKGFFDRHIDLVLGTHPDQDHIGGLVQVFNRYKVEKYMEPGVDVKTPANDALHKIIIENKIQTIPARRGIKIILDKEKEIYLMILFPDRLAERFKSDTNESSIVAKLVYGSSTLMLTGDSPQDVEKYLSEGVLSEDFSLKSEILKIGHHGSKTSSSEIFVQNVNPELAVISVGAGNKFGHPNKETLDTLNKYKIKILRTDELGRIKLISDGKRFK